MNSRTKAAIGAAALLVLLAIGWSMLWGNSVDPAVAALETQRRLVFSDEATDTDRQAFRQAVDQLTEDQRRQLFERGRPEMERRMAERMNELFSKPPAELRREAQQRAADIIANRANRGSEPPRGGPPGGGGRGPMTEAQRESRQKQRLDRVDPGTRAQFSEFRRMINDELAARGQEPMSGRDMRGMMGGRPPRG